MTRRRGKRTQQQAAQVRSAEGSMWPDDGGDIDEQLAEGGEGSTPSPRHSACERCGRPMLEQVPQVCGKCRSSMSDEERADLMPRVFAEAAFAVGLVAESGAFRLVELSLPIEVIREHTVREHEREFLPMVLPKVADLAQAWAESRALERSGEAGE